MFDFVSSLRRWSSRTLLAILFLAGCSRGPEIPLPPSATDISPNSDFRLLTASDEAVRRFLPGRKVRCLQPGAFAVSVDFKDCPQRVTWDIPIKLDLKARRGLQFDFYCTALAEFQSFSLYFKSGEGWYHGVFSPDEEGVWTRMRVRKSECRVEGRPDGWEKIEALRISGWRAGTGTATCAFANLAPLGGGNPDVLIITAESQGVKDPARARDSLRFGGRIVNTLLSLGLEASLVADSELEAGLLKRARAIVFPYNSVFPKEKLPLLEDYMAQGKRFLACYCLPSALEPHMGVKLTGAVRTTDNGGEGIGGFLRVGRGLPHQPVFSPQASWITQTLAKGKSVEIVAEWATGKGKSLGIPALVRTNKGLFMSHVWLGGATGEPLALMRAIMIDLAPDLEKKMTARMDAVAAEDARRTAWLKACPSARDRFRACWCHDARGLGGGRDWEGTIRFLKENGFNAVLPNLAWAGTAFYESEVLPIDASVAKRGDAFRECLAACRKYGVACHVWKVCWNMGQYATKDFERRMIAAQRVQVDANGASKTRWLCPSHPENQKLEIEAMVELAKKGPDGIHFDYIRYPDSVSCYCAGCRRRFEAQLGHSLTNWPAIVHDPKSSTDIKAAWKRFRIANISAVVRAVSERVRKACPNVKISAATYRNAKAEALDVGQDWGSWCRAGWLDFVCPMDYIDSSAMFRGQVAMQKKEIGKAKLYPGIGLSCFRNDGEEAVKLAREIEIVRQLGLEGFTVFNLDRTAVRVLPQLRAGTNKLDPQ